MHTRTGPHAFFIISTYCSGMSRPSLSTARLITCQDTSRSRTCSTSSTQREVIQAHGHRGSNQKSSLVAAMTGSCPGKQVAQPARCAVAG